MKMNDQENCMKITHPEKRKRNANRRSKKTTKIGIGMTCDSQLDEVVSNSHKSSGHSETLYYYRSRSQKENKSECKDTVIQDISKNAKSIPRDTVNSSVPALENLIVRDTEKSVKQKNRHIQESCYSNSRNICNDTVTDVKITNERHGTNHINEFSRYKIVSDHLKLDIYSNHKKSVAADSKINTICRMPLLSEVENQLLATYMVEQSSTSGGKSTPKPRGKEKNNLNINVAHKDMSQSIKKERVDRLEDTLYPQYLSKEELMWVSAFGIIHSGVIRINPKNCNDAYIPAPDKGQDILVRGVFDRNRALEGDEVYYVLKGEDHARVNQESGEPQRTAIVVALKTVHHSRTAIVVPSSREENLSPNHLHFSSFLCIPTDSRIPNFRVKRINFPQKLLSSPDLCKTYFFAKIIDWKDIRHAEGQIIKEVGYMNDLQAETSAIMLTYGLQELPYPDYLKKYYPTIPYVISKEEILTRMDLRKECIFTIDPVNAKDLDDAVSCKQLGNGNYEVGVHISDVTHYLRQGTPLDEAISARATSIYLVQRVYHMLPDELCRLCSLTPDEDKLAFSVFWEITPEAEVVRHSFTRSVIRSCGQFSYEQAQAIIEGCDPLPLPTIYDGHSVKTIVDTVTILNNLAIKMRKRRFDEGALRIDQTKITFSLDDDYMPLKYTVYENKECHRLIEEFMLLANMTVAENINTSFPQIALLRCHEPPSMHMMMKLQKKFNNHGIKIDISSSKTVHEFLSLFNGEDNYSKARMVVLSAFLAKPMTRAKYFCSDTLPEKEDRKHYALNVSLYTHFTSPMRRYADVMVHRLLAASLGYGTPLCWSPDDVQKVALNCNKQKYAAKMAGEESTKLFFNLYIEKHGPLTFEAVVSDIKGKHINCFVLDNGFNYNVPLEGKNRTVEVVEGGVVNVIWQGKRQDEICLQVIEMFSIIKIKLEKEKLHIKSELLYPS